MELVLGNSEYVRSVGLRRGLLIWKPQEWRDALCLTTVDKDECMSFLGIYFLWWGQDLDLVVGPCDKGWEKYMCS